MMSYAQKCHTQLTSILDLGTFIETYINPLKSYNTLLWQITVKSLVHVNNQRLTLSTQRVFDSH